MVSTFQLIYMVPTFQMSGGSDVSDDRDVSNNPDVSVDPDGAEVSDGSNLLNGLNLSYDSNIPDSPAFYVPLVSLKVILIQNLYP